MSSIRLNRFSSPEILAGIRPQLLYRFLEPYKSYFQERDFDLNRLHDGEQDAVWYLSNILISPSATAPYTLFDALFCIQEVGTPQNADLLEAVAADADISPLEQSTLLELALTLWLAVPEMLQHLHRRQLTTRVRSFEYFSATGDASAPFDVNVERIRQLEHSLSLYFTKKDRGSGCQVHHYPQEQEHWFLISHGERYKRETTWEEGTRRIIGYRPEKYDFVAYNTLTEELKVHAASVTLREHYRKQFGFYLFGRENHFPGRNKYTLSPLLQGGETALFANDIPGIEQIRLTELSYAIESGIAEVRTHKANDVFAVLRQHSLRIPQDARLLKAKFSLTLSNQPKLQTLTLKPANVALYSRDSDEERIETWLNHRGFITKGKTSSYEQSEHILEVC